LKKTRFVGAGKGRPENTVPLLMAFSPGRKRKGKKGLKKKGPNARGTGKKKRNGGNVWGQWRVNRDGRTSTWETRKEKKRAIEEGDDQEKEQTQRGLIGENQGNGTIVEKKKWEVNTETVQ